MEFSFKILVSRCHFQVFFVDIFDPFDVALHVLAMLRFKILEELVVMSLFEVNLGFQSLILLIQIIDSFLEVGVNFWRDLAYDSL